MIIETTKLINASLLTVSGRMDALTTIQFETAIEQLVSSGEEAFVIDFNGLEYISSAGLRSLLSTGKHLSSSNKQIHIANVSESVKKVFDFSGFNTIFHIHNSVNSALTAIS